VDCFVTEELFAPLLDACSIHQDMDVAAKQAYLKKSTLVEGKSNGQCIIH
jgi:hypothetical protein